jgi:hypothetical protein
LTIKLNDHFLCCPKNLHDWISVVLSEKGGKWVQKTKGTEKREMTNDKSEIEMGLIRNGTVI